MRQDVEKRRIGTYNMHCIIISAGLEEALNLVGFKNGTSVLTEKVVCMDSSNYCRPHGGRFHP